MLRFKAARWQVPVPHQKLANGEKLLIEPESGGPHEGLPAIISGQKIPFFGASTEKNG
jgi:hypothetical protein